jgi:hypothetical protein
MGWGLGAGVRRLISRPRRLINFWSLVATAIPLAFPLRMTLMAAVTYTLRREQLGLRED